MTRGADLRASIAAEYDVTGPAAEALVDAIIATANELEQLEEAVAEYGAVIDGARGQKIANPALAAIARHRKLLAALIAEAFPGEHESTSQKAARAARARWDKERTS